MPLVEVWLYYSRWVLWFSLFGSTCSQTARWEVSLLFKFRNLRVRVENPAY